VAVNAGRCKWERPLEHVGRITGTASCRWRDPQTAPTSPAVPVGGKFDLTSGLVEITYRSGARVILEGPCVYETDSRAVATSPSAS